MNAFIAWIFVIVILYNFAPGFLRGLLILVGIVVGIIMLWALVGGSLEASRRKEAEERSRKKAEEEAQKRARLAKEASERKARLQACGAVVYLAGSQNKMVKCSNGHRYMFQDFTISHSGLERDQWSGEYYTGTYDEMGCPACKSKILTFDDGPSATFRVCNACKLAWDARQYSSCPSCSPSPPTPFSDVLFASEAVEIKKGYGP